MKNKMIALGTVVIIVVAVAVYLFYTEGVSTVVSNSPAVSQLSNQASSNLNQQLNQATSGITTQDVINTVNSPS